MPTEAQKKATARYKKEHYKRIPLNIQNGYFDEVLKPACDRLGIPVNTFIKQAIAEKIERDTFPGSTVSDTIKA